MLEQTSKKVSKTKNEMPVIGFKIEPETKSIIKRIVDFNDGKKHVLEELFEGPEDKRPDITSVGVVRVEREGRWQWVSVTLKTKGDRILEIIADEPNNKAIAVESTKMAFMEQLVDTDDTL